jgi:hypothetical protein
MARILQPVDLGQLSQSVREARERKGWTLQQLSHELWASGFPTSQNKLWRLENCPPRRVDTELLLWLEKVLGIPLLDAGEGKPVLVEDVLALIDGFERHRRGEGPPPGEPASGPLQVVHAALGRLAG